MMYGRWTADGGGDRALPRVFVVPASKSRWVMRCGVRDDMTATSPSTIRCPKTAFTLVELLVVITIVGILIALLLPAVQAAREAARRIQCTNNLKQLSMGCLTHESAHGFLPTGGWGWGWAGDPDRGFDKRQPGGWLFNILPYIEQEPLRSLGAGMNETDKRDAGRRQAETVLATFICPTRRQAVAYPYVIAAAGEYVNINRPNVIGRSDYAGNAGEAKWGWAYGPGSPGEGPAALATGDGWTESDWQDEGDGYCGTEKDATGVIFRRSTCKMARISDGTSSTYLIGERYLNALAYTTGDVGDDDQGWDMGYDTDVNRLTRNEPDYWPRQDIPGSTLEGAFGSAHATSFHMAFCDGSVQPISYTIDPEVHRCLGSRNDDTPIGADKY